jgi:protein TonB
MEKEAAMYADRMSLSHGPRPIPFGASLAVSSAVIAALIFSTPALMQKKPPAGAIDTWNVPETPPPPPLDDVKPKPEMPRDTTIVAPQTPLKPLESQPPMDTTTTIDPGPPPTTPGTFEGTGTTVAEPPPPPLPPLLSAELDPRYAASLQPEYPGVELRQSREGTVTVRVRIGIDGRVKEVEKVSATSDAFFEATRRQALGRWRFKPATRGGVPEETWKRMSVRFKMTS